LSDNARTVFHKRPASRRFSVGPQERGKTFESVLAAALEARLRCWPVPSAPRTPYGRHRQGPARQGPMVLLLAYLAIGREHVKPLAANVSPTYWGVDGTDLGPVDRSLEADSFRRQSA
jgi:hypothetical protein